MKQKYQLQMGIAQYKNVATPNHTLALSNEVCNFVLAQGAKVIS